EQVANIRAAERRRHRISQRRHAGIAIGVARARRKNYRRLMNRDRKWIGLALPESSLPAGKLHVVDIILLSVLDSRGMSRKLPNRDGALPRIAAPGRDVLRRAVVYLDTAKLNRQHQRVAAHDGFGQRRRALPLPQVLSGRVPLVYDLAVAHYEQGSRVQ